jgi:hypothetical protein
MYFVHKNSNFIETLLYVQYIIYWYYPKRLVCSYVSELRSLVIGYPQDRCMIAKVRNVVHAGQFVHISSNETGKRIRR